MKSLKSILALSLSFSLLFSFLSFAIPSVSAQDTNIALQRGYRTGYSDGYMAGYRDAIDNTAKSYARHSDYAKADRAYNKDYGSVEDYRDGYQQGFEFGYDTGFEKRSFDATIPMTPKKRGVLPVNTNTEAAKTTEPAKPVEGEVIAETAQPKETENVSATIDSNETINNQTYSQTTSQTGDRNAPPTLSTRTTNVLPIPSDDAIIVIPAETELVIELANEITTAQTSEGDKFTARVVSPYEISGAIIEGRVSKIQKPGRIKRRAEVMLSFDRIIISENRWSNYNAILTEVLPIKGDNVKRIDLEGTVEGKSSVKDDSIKLGGATGTGLVIGAIAGGPVGAAVGAGVGAAFGVGAVVIDRGKHIRLQKNQQLRIKTAYETQIR
jgi:hypothetical protein